MRKSMKHRLHYHIKTSKRVQQIATSDASNSSNNDLQVSYSAQSDVHNFKSSFTNIPTTSTVSEPNSQDGLLCHGTVIEKVLSFLIYIKKQNKEIVQLFTKKVTPTTLTQFRLEDLPVNLPISTQTDLDILETFLKDNQNFSTMCSYLATLDGRDLTSKTNKILKYLLTDDLISNYSFYGKRMNKRPFSSLKCCSTSGHKINFLSDRKGN